MQCFKCQISGKYRVS